MPQQYKRALCSMCPIKAECDHVRWSGVCGSCAQSVACLSKTGIDDPNCQKLVAAWRDLPRTCMLAENLVNQKVEGGGTHFDTDAQCGVLCPRCGQRRGMLSTGHSLNIAFKRVSRTEFVCNNCNIHASREF